MWKLFEVFFIRDNDWHVWSAVDERTVHRYLWQHFRESVMGGDIPVFPAGEISDEVMRLYRPYGREDSPCSLFSKQLNPADFNSALISRRQQQLEPPQPKQRRLELNDASV